MPRRVSYYEYEDGFADGVDSFDYYEECEEEEELPLEEGEEDEGYWEEGEAEEEDSEVPAEGTIDVNAFNWGAVEDDSQSDAEEDCTLEAPTHFSQVHELIEYVAYFLIPKIHGTNHLAAAQTFRRLAAMRLVSKRWSSAVHPVYKAAMRPLIAPYGIRQLSWIRRVFAHKSRQTPYGFLKPQLRCPLDPWFLQMMKSLTPGGKATLTPEDYFFAVLSVDGLLQKLLHRGLDLTNCTPLKEFLDEKESLEAIRQALIPRVCVPHTYLYKKGDPNRGEMYFLPKGEWLRVMDVESWYSIVQGFCGTSALMGDGPREGSLYSDRWTHVFVLRRSDYKAVLHDFHERQRAKGRFSEVVFKKNSKAHTAEA